MNAAAQVSAVWGAVALVLGLAALVLFRNQIGAAIDRWRGATFGKDKSVDLSGPSPQAQVEAQKEPHKESADLLPAPAPQSGLPALPPPNPLYAPLEEDLRRRVEAAFPGAQDTQLAWALRVAAQATVERNHEQTYRIIFGSQILALKEINIRGFITAAQAQEIYDMAAAAFPDLYATFPFKNWGGFLLDQGLVVIPEDPVTDESKVLLTPAGKDFLFFLTGRGLPENKGG
ncbi:hypothetical protein [Microvirga sp. Mcv34]|uniref:hypothetical protein n=1 Tax=Microvirga sp. Mcv34 TaxID=2926016 RepID=UPI0021C83454|nr:hypothetical protein [Microvirga sp. Mcv34]